MEQQKHLEKNIYLHPMYTYYRYLPYVGDPHFITTQVSLSPESHVSSSSSSIYYENEFSYHLEATLISWWPAGGRCVCVCVHLFKRLLSVTHNGGASSSSRSTFTVGGF